jgi:palmitoyl-protein thioesterase
MGISSAPPCKPTEFFCKAAQIALRAGAWTPYAQSSVVPAQYFRNQASIQDYLEHDSFLRDINNERWNDTQPVSGADHQHNLAARARHDHQERNTSYIDAVKSLDNFVLFAFT